MTRAKIGLFAAAALSWSAQATAGSRATPEFESGETRPVSIALLPVEATVVRTKVVDSENLIEEGIAYGAFFNSQAEAAMAARGYTVEKIDPERINADPQLQEYVVDANRQFDEMMSHVRPKRIKRRIYNAGDDVRLLAEYLGVDAVAFSRLSVTVTGVGGSIVAGLFGVGGGGSSPGTLASLALVDGASGDLEAYFDGIHIGLPGEKTPQELHEQIAKVAAGALEELPDADPSARLAVATDEDILSDVESLLSE